MSVNKLHIFILKSSNESVKSDLVESLYHNNCIVDVFSDLEKMLTSSLNMPELIILDEPQSKIEKDRTSFKLDQCFPLAEVIYLSGDMFTTTKTLKYSVKQNSITKKMSVAFDEMLYYIAYHEHFDTDTLVIKATKNESQRFFVPIAVGLLSIVVVGALYFA